MSVSSTVPSSPRVTSIRQAMYKKSPVRSPLREVIKSRCQERMRADRDRIVSGVRNISMAAGPGDQLRRVVRDELLALRGGRKRLGFGYSMEDVDEALLEVADIEAELLEEMYGVQVNYAENMSSLENQVPPFQILLFFCKVSIPQVVCPVCQEACVEDAGAGVVRCRARASCGLVVVVVGGVAELLHQLEAVVAAHEAGGCGLVLNFVRGDNCVVALCDKCDFCHYIGGF